MLLRSTVKKRVGYFTQNLTRKMTDDESDSENDMYGSDIISTLLRNART